MRAELRDFLRDELGKLRTQGLLREPEAASPGWRLNLCSNDYLGYASLPIDGSLAWARAGAGASRLVLGTDPAHDRAEAALADWLGTEAALLFSSGYAANVGLLASIARPGDLIVSDALNHASLIDGCRLSGATIRIVAHADVAAVGGALQDAVGFRHRFVVTESYFSMDGDGPDLQGLRDVCDALGASLIVDEAHALGVFGPEGRGRCAEVGVQPDVLVGTCGKSLGLQGAFVAGPSVLRTWLWNKARSFVFSTGLAPVLASLLVERIGLLRADDGGRTALSARAAQLRDGLAELGVAPFGLGPIIRWIVGSEGTALGIAQHCRELGVAVQAIRPPTVPVGTARLRLTVSARHSEANIAEALRVLGEAGRAAQRFT